MPFWIEAIGCVGSFFAVVTYWMKDMLPLRVAALLSCIFFIAYAAMIGSWPLLGMELFLLPINAFRLLELRKAGAVSRAELTAPSGN